MPEQKGQGAHNQHCAQTCKALHLNRATVAKERTDHISVTITVYIMPYFVHSPAQLEAAMRELFNVPKETVCRVWHKYKNSMYEELSMPEQTLQDAGLYAGQVSQGVEGRGEREVGGGFSDEREVEEWKR